MKMTIHRGLAELKLIDSKIEKQSAEIIPSGVFQKDKLVNGIYNKEDFEKSAKSKYDSVLALIERKVAIKSAIVASNTATIVEVAGKKMSVADAITFKTVTKFKTNLVKMLKKQHQLVLTSFTRGNEQVNQNCQSIIEAALGKENVKASSGDVDAVRKPYMEANEFHLFDPLKVEDKIESVEKEVSEFETEIDAVLSEINAVTFIEVPE